jgi:hypothetical protein
MHEHYGDALRSSRCGQHPAQHATAPALRQQPATLADQIIYIDVAKGDQQQENQGNTKDGVTYTGLADNGPHGERGDDGDKQRTMPVGCEISPHRPAQLFQSAIPRCCIGYLAGRQ